MACASGTEEGHISVRPFWLPAARQSVSTENWHGRARGGAMATAAETPTPMATMHHHEGFTELHYSVEFTT